MAQRLLRVTTEYVPAEDRFRLSGELEGDAPLVLWLTQRLLQRLVPALLRWLEQQQGGGGLPGEVVQGFAQQAAKAALVPQAPVRAVSGSREWRVSSVDVGGSGRGVVLRFRADEAGADADDGVLLYLEAKPLRQWLGILYEGYVKAGWPLDLWPVWLREGAEPVRAPLVLH